MGKPFFRTPFGGSYLHADTDFSKVPTLAPQCHCHIRCTLPNDGRGGARARARTITLEWPHWVGGSFALFALLVLLAILFNYFTLKWAAAVQHPWLSAIVLADQREEAQRTQERMQGHLNAMAIRLGE